MTVEKASIKILSTAGQPKIPVMFNPSQYSITRNLNYAEIGVPGLSMPLLQFVRGEVQTLDLVLFLDSSDRVGNSSLDAPVPGSGGGVDLKKNAGAGLEPVPADKWARLGASPYCEHRLMALRLLAEVDRHLHAPPVIEFSWGGSPRFRGVVANFKEEFVMFGADGNVQRARVTLMLKSYVSAEEQFRRINPQSPDRTKTHVVRAGERLDMLAAAEYGDPGKWHVIAAANNIARPRVLASGTLLIIPPLA
jgi:hypothetical protein